MANMNSNILRLTLFGKYEEKEKKSDLIFRRLPIYSGLTNWVFMTTNTINQTDICKYDTNQNIITQKNI